MWVCLAALVHVLAYIIMKPVAQHGVKNGIITLKTEFIMIQIVGSDPDGIRTHIVRTGILNSIH